MQGWECPKCGAVMHPDGKVCINCRGNTYPVPVIPVITEPRLPLIVVHYGAAFSTDEPFTEKVWYGSTGDYINYKLYER